MVVKKRNETFNVYTIELSFGELKAFWELTKEGGGAMVDEMRANLEFYFERLPPPGAEPDEGKKDKEHGKELDAKAVEEPAVEEPEHGAPVDAPSEPPTSAPHHAEPEEADELPDPAA